MTLWRRAVGTSAILAALLLVPLPASGGSLWDLAAMLGYAAAVVLVLIYLYPLHRAGLPHRRLFTVTQHRRLGWLALVLALLHVLLLLAREPLTAQYLLPSAPLYMLCGLAALLALAALVPTGLSARRALRGNLREEPVRAPARIPARTHAILSAAILGLIGAHIVGSGQLLDQISKVSSVCLVLALTIAWSVLGLRRHVQQRLWLPAIMLGFAATLVLLLIPAPTVRSYLLEPLASRSGLPPPLDFPHEPHRDVNCLICHHNLGDHTGTGSCVACHRELPTASRHSAEATFHVFCRDCHSTRAAEGAKHGPTRACAACHRSAEAQIAKDIESMQVLAASDPIL